MYTFIQKRSILYLYIRVDGMGGGGGGVGREEIKTITISPSLLK